ncbi:hypothetical protein BpHYR1_043539 [Brachionus plicatilis]|uniref:Uncharacterized protein n=1 Tax=Brachionus plicatilis TaxID=10195 RepID=A0A3M7PCD7_BRAPC|nr:hypothetical protein BpHYR1_043539 [Brachionus plicatilis]
MKVEPYVMEINGQQIRDFNGTEKMRLLAKIDILNDFKEENSMIPDVTQIKTWEWIVPIFVCFMNTIILILSKELEKLNDETTTHYFKATNKKEKSIDQILRRLRIDNHLLI